MNKISISSSILEAKEKEGIGIIPFLTSGYPSVKESEEIVKALIEEDLASAIEIGIPFSDPIAEGKTIQKSSSIALENGVDINTTLNSIEKINSFKDNNVPIITMGYYNPILKMGLKNFFSASSNVGVKGVIVADVPNEELQKMQEIANNFSIDTIPLVPLNASQERVNHACEMGQGFIYCVSVLGVTGTREALSKDVEKKVNTVKEKTDLPVAVGFGISRPSHIEELKKFADGAVIGSAIIDVIMESKKNDSVDRVIDFISKLSK
tara:strand:+ start:954 stop:1751 length:798 start_codon:yes stop_codon:yes gene_type:complete